MTIAAQQYQTTIATGGEPWVLTGLNYSTFGFSVAGTISAGDLTVQVTVDGKTWQAVAVYQNDSALSGGQVVSAGTYRSSIAGYSQVAVVPSNDFEGLVNISADPSPAVFFIFTSGGTPLTYDLPLDLSGDVVSILGLDSVGADGQFPMSNGTDWEYVDSTGTGDVVLSASPTFTGTVSGAASTWSGGVSVTGGVFAQGKFGYDATYGAYIQGKTGSAYDLILISAAENTIFRNPTGTDRFEFPDSEGGSISGPLTTADITANGVIDGDSFSVGGTPGAAGGTFTVITSITVENGIVTAISGT